MDLFNYEKPSNELFVEFLSEQEMCAFEKEMKDLEVATRKVIEKYIVNPYAESSYLSGKEDKWFLNHFNLPSSKVLSMSKEERRELFHNHAKNRKSCEYCK